MISAAEGQRTAIGIGRLLRIQGTRTPCTVGYWHWFFCCGCDHKLMMNVIDLECRYSVYVARASEINWLPSQSLQTVKAAQNAFSCSTDRCPLQRRTSASTKTSRAARAQHVTQRARVMQKGCFLQDFAEDEGKNEMPEARFERTIFA